MAKSFKEKLEEYGGMDKFVSDQGGMTAMYQKAYSRFSSSEKIQNGEHPNDEARGYFI